MKFLQRRRAAHSSRFTRIRVILVGIATLLPTINSIVPNPAAAAPGNPGVPSAPVVLFREEFENVDMDVAPGFALLTTYNSTVYSGNYEAESPWDDPGVCNGIILAFGSPATGCPGFDALLHEIPRVLGELHGDPSVNNNFASGFYSNIPASPNGVIFRTDPATPIPVSVTNRFVTLTADIAGPGCGPGAPLFRFFLFDGTTEFEMTDAPVQPCDSPDLVRTYTLLEQSAKFVRPENSLLYSGNGLGVVLRNLETTGAGNNGAFDNVTVLDATPQLDTSFSPTTVAVGATSTLTFTITNTSELASKNGWSFTDTLPAGLKIASPTGAVNNCGGSIVATAGGGSVSATGNLNTDQISCTIKVNVSSTLDGTYQNGPSNFSLVGLNAPSTGTLIVIPQADLVATKVCPPGPVPGGGTFDCTVNAVNLGPSNATSVVLTETVPANTTMTAVTAPAGWTCSPAPPAGPGTNVLCTIPTLAPNGPSGVNFVFTFRVSEDLASPTTTQNSVRVASQTFDPMPDNNAPTANNISIVPGCGGVVATYVGTDGNNKATGGPGIDVMVGLGGVDKFTGLGGNDRLCGNDGNDDLTGGDGNDYLSGGAGADNLTGIEGNDELVGGTENDVLTGGAGDDTLTAGDGVDTCTGGAGNDTGSSCETSTQIP